MPSCTGCFPTFNGFDSTSTSSQNALLGWSGYVPVSGLGSYTGIYMPSGLYIRYYAIGGTNGKCTGFSGSLQGVAMTGGGSGLFSWNGNTYTCTGMGSCQVSMDGVAYVAQLNSLTNSFVVQWNAFTSTTFTTTVQTYNFFTNPIIYGETVTGTTTCGFTSTLYNQLSIFPQGMAPGTTGYLVSNFEIPFGCAPCLSGA